MTFCQNHHIVVKLKSVYETFVLVKRCYSTNFWVRWKEVEIGLADSIIRKILLVHHRLYLLEKKSNSNQSVRQSKGVVRNKQLHAYGKRKKILLSDTEWLNDNIMNAGQRLICKALGRLESHQSVLNCQKRGIPFFNISEEHIQLMHNGSNQWLTLFSSNDRVRICDGFYTNLTPVIKSCLKPSTSLKLNKIRNYQLP